MPLPPVDASPQGVVTAYVAALNAHDVRTARALLTPAHAKVVEGGLSSAIVGVRFVLEQYKVESMENGPTVWGYMLIRHSTNQRWLIYDEGLG